MAKFPRTPFDEPTPQGAPAARYNSLLHRLHGTEGSAADAPRIVPGLVHQVTIENDRIEHHVLMGEEECWGTSIQPGVAAQLATGYLSNPVNSGVIAIARPTITADGNEILTVGTTNIDPAGTIQGRGFRDSRRYKGGIGNSAEQSVVFPGVLTQAGPPSFNINYTFGVLAFTPFTIPFEVVVGPGCFYVFTGSVANTTLRIGWAWRQRAALDSELIKGLG